jgi:hypothetical protein
MIRNLKPKGKTKPRRRIILRKRKEKSSSKISLKMCTKNARRLERRKVIKCKS